MKELVKSLPLMLFLILLCTLSISIYFGNLTINQSIENLETSPSSTTPNQTLNPTLVADIKTILQFFKDINSDTTPKETTKPKKSKEENEEDEEDEEDEEEWFKKWNKIVNSVDNINYVPNVCPDCEKKQNKGTCENCKSLGGSCYKNRFSDFIASHGAGYKGQGVFVGYGYGGRDPNDPTLSKLAEQTGSGLVDVTKTALRSATGLGLGAMDLVEDVGSGATGLLRDTGSGAIGLVRDTGSGAIGLVRDLGSGVKDVLKTNPVQINEVNQQNKQAGASGAAAGGYNNPYQSGYYSQGTYNLPNNPLGISGIDPYSYNGALVSKGTNFIPVTSDFSSFRK